MLLPGSTVFRGNLADLDGEPPKGDGECIALVQKLTHIGHSSTWRPGDRVVDLYFLEVGTIIANFEFDKTGRGRFPCRHGYHVGLFAGFGPRFMSNNQASNFDIVDQWVGRRPDVIKKRTLHNYGEKSAWGLPENAFHYYVVLTS